MVTQMEDKSFLEHQVEEILLRKECMDFITKTPLLTPFLRLLLEDIALEALK